MIIPYNKRQKETIDLRFHTYVYNMLMDLGYDTSLLGIKYFYEMLMIACAVNTNLVKNPDIKYKDLTLKNLEETLANDINVSAKEIKNNLDYAFNNIDLKLARKNFGPVFEERYTDYFNPKLLQANELLHYLLDKIEFRYSIQTSMVSPSSYDWTKHSLDIENETYKAKLRERLKKQKEIFDNKEDD